PKPETPTRPPPPQRSPELHGWLHGGVVAIGGIAPTNHVALLAGELGADVVVPTERTFLRPLFRFSVTYGRSEFETSFGPKAPFEWTAAKVGACPVALPLTAQVELRPCAFFEFGLVVTKGVDALDAVESRRWRPAFGPSVRLDYAFLTHLLIQAELGV